MVLQDRAEHESAYSILTSDLTTAYLCVGDTLIQGGRYTRALQHFKQGVHLFQSIQAHASVAVCYSCLASVFACKTRSLGMAQLETLAELEIAGHESVKHFDLALEVRSAQSMKSLCCTKGEVARHEWR
jgi:hypothetical protein